MPDTPETETSPRRSFTREIEVAGEDLIRRIRELAADSRVRRVRVYRVVADLAPSTRSRRTRAAPPDVKISACRSGAWR